MCCREPCVKPSSLCNSTAHICQKRASEEENENRVEIYWKMLFVFTRTQETRGGEKVVQRLTQHCPLSWWNRDDKVRLTRCDSMTCFRPTTAAITAPLLYHFLNAPFLPHEKNSLTFFPLVLIENHFLFFLV